MHKALEKALEIQSFDNKMTSITFIMLSNNLRTNKSLHQFHENSRLTNTSEGPNSILLSWADCQHHQDRSDLPMEYQCPTHTTAFTFGDEQLSVVPYFKYLGTILAEDSGIDNDVQSCITVFLNCLHTNSGTWDTMTTTCNSFTNPLNQFC